MSAKKQATPSTGSRAIDAALRELAAIEKHGHAAISGYEAELVNVDGNYDGSAGDRWSELGEDERQLMHDLEREDLAFRDACERLEKMLRRLAKKLAKEGA